MQTVTPGESISAVSTILSQPQASSGAEFPQKLCFCLSSSIFSDLPKTNWAIYMTIMVRFSWVPILVPKIPFKWFFRTLYVNPRSRGRNFRQTFLKLCSNVFLSNSFDMFVGQKNPIILARVEGVSPKNLVVGLSRSRPTFEQHSA